MAGLSRTTEVLLSSCARFMVLGRVLDIDLTSISADFLIQPGRDEVIAFMAGEIETHSRHRLTLREADRALFSGYRASDVAIFVAVCPAAVAQNVITERTAEMTFYVIDPHGAGIKIWLA